VMVPQATGGAALMISCTGLLGAALCVRRAISQPARLRSNSRTAR
jgi:hypothetical protein